MIFGFHQKSLRSFYVTHRARASGTILFPIARSQFNRQGDRSFQWRTVSVAHSDDLSAWQELYGLGIWYLTVEADEFERMRTDKRVRRPFRLDLRHVAGNALAAGAVLFVMRMLFERGGARPVG
jgi:hypothetical protein